MQSMSIFVKQSVVLVRRIPVWLSKSSSVSFVGNYYCHSSAINGDGGLPSSVRSGDADEILNQILYDNPSISTEDCCVKYVEELCRADNLTAAVNIPQILRGREIFLSPRAYDYLLEVAAERDDVYMLCEIFKDLVLNYGPLTSSSYLIFVRALGKYEDNHALNFLKDIMEMELSRKDVVLNRIIYALGKCGQADNALMVFDYMKGMICKPDLVTYNTVLEILGRLGKVDEMLHEFNSLKLEKIDPDLITYNTVLNGLRKMGRYTSCLVYFKEMCENRIRPDVLTFKALIESLGRSGNVEEALKIFYEMKCYGIEPSVHIYRALIFSLRKMGKIELALEFYNEMNKLFPGPVVPRDFRNRKP